MATLEKDLTEQHILPPRQAEPHPRLWTVDEYYRAAEAGILKPDERVELIEGVIYTKVSPQLTPHATAILMSARALGKAFENVDCNLRTQLPIHIDSQSEPEPDISIARGQLELYVDHHPASSEILLLIEIADSSLRQDTLRKRRLYGQGNIPEYWVVSLPQQKLIVFREPGSEGYALSEEHEPGNEITPLLGNGRSVQVRDLIPQIKEVNS